MDKQAGKVPRINSLFRIPGQRSRGRWDKVLGQNAAEISLSLPRSPSLFLSLAAGPNPTCRQDVRSVGLRPLEARSVYLHLRKPLLRPHAAASPAPKCSGSLVPPDVQILKCALQVHEHPELIRNMLLRNRARYFREHRVSRTSAADSWSLPTMTPKSLLPPSARLQRTARRSQQPDSTQNKRTRLKNLRSVLGQRIPGFQSRGISSKVPSWFETNATAYRPEFKKQADCPLLCQLHKIPCHEPQIPGRPDKKTGLALRQHSP